MQIVDMADEASQSYRGDWSRVVASVGSGKIVVAVG